MVILLMFPVRYIGVWLSLCPYLSVIVQRAGPMTMILVCLILVSTAFRVRLIVCRCCVVCRRGLFLSLPHLLLILPWATWPWCWNLSYP